MGLGLGMGMWLGHNPAATGGGVPDTTAPTLSSPVGTQTGSTTATIGATTDEGNGTMYGVVTTSATAPTAVQVEAGQNNGGTAAVFAGSTSVASTGAKTISATGLTASTAYYAHIMHKDAAGNRSAVVSSAQFTTAAGVAAMTWDAANKTASITLVTSLQMEVGSGAGTVYGTRAISPDLAYWEVTPNHLQNLIGVADSSAGLPTTDVWGPSAFGYVATSHACGYYGNDADIVYNDGYTSVGVFTASAPVGVAVRRTAKKIWFTNDGTTWLPSGDPAANTGGQDISLISATMFPVGQAKGGSNHGQTANFAGPFAFTVPSGFAAP